MRSVEYCREGFYGGIDKRSPARFGVGTFHGFYSEGSNEEGLECFALVEVPSGIVEMMSIARIKFINNQPKSKEGSVDSTQQLKAEIADIADDLCNPNVGWTKEDIINFGMILKKLSA